MAGWYEDEGGAAFLLTPSAEGGLFRIDLPGSMHRAYPPDPAALTTHPLPDAPYAVRQLSFASDVALSGTLLIPAGTARAGAVMIHGSGPSTRDNGWYMAIADHLARRGVAVLLPDKRGTGQSRGVWQTASFDDFAADARAGLIALRARVEAPRFGFIGISQGGWVAPVAASDGSADFAAAVSTAQVPPRVQLAHETQQTLREDGVPDWMVPLVFPIAYRLPQWARDRWWRVNGDFDPVSSWRHGRVEGLIVIGREDERDNVPVAASEEAFTTIRAGRGDAVRLVVYEGSGHALYAPATTHIRDDFLETLTAFVIGNAG